MRLLYISLALCLAVSLPLESVRAAEELPLWVQKAATLQPSSAQPDGTDTLVLLNEGFIEITADGHRITRQRTVVRILREEGRKLAREGVSYTRPGDKIRDFNAWIQTSKGTRHFRRKDAIDVALDSEALYSESRLALLDLSEQAEVNCLCAWESIKDEPPTFAEDEWDFQSNAPVAVARCVVRVPPDWSLSATLLNRPSLASAPSEEGQVWELRDLPAWQTEPHAPTARPASARLRFTYAPPSGSKANLVAFRNWSEVAAFGREKFVTALKSDPALRAKTIELCAHAGTPWEKISALTRYVQALRYVSISINLRQLGGYVPHAAPEVFRSGYGDCKDKAALLCTMLAETGITSFPVLCFSGDRTAVTASAASPLQFNHVFLAIAVDEAIASPFVVSLGARGRVLLFDPTDPYTRVGDFPVINQGSMVLVCAPDVTELLQVPFAPIANNLHRITTNATLAADGSLQAKLDILSLGGSASAQRERAVDLAKARQPLPAWLQSNIPGSNVEQAEMMDDVGDNSVTLRATLRLPRYAQPIGRDLLAVKPLWVGSQPGPSLTSKTRRQPIVLQPVCDELVFEFTIPNGYGLKEAGPATRMEQPFGSYSADTTCDDRRVTFRRKLILEPVELPAEKAPELRAFLDAVRKRDKTPILLEHR